MTKTSSQPIYQSKWSLSFTFLSVLSFACLSWAGGMAMVAQHKEKGALWLTLGLALVLTFFSVKMLLMIVSSGKPIATLGASGITLRNGKNFPWSSIEGLHIHTTEVNFFKIRTDLVIKLTKGKKSVLFVKLTQDRLADLIEEAHK